MSLVGRIFAGFVMGLCAYIVGGMIGGLAVGGGEHGLGAGRWIGMGLGGLTFLLAVFAARARYAWGRGFLMLGLMSSRELPPRALAARKHNRPAQ
jgi:hypothetical protein